MYLITNSYYFPILHLLAAFYNRGGVCLLRGTDWIFIYNSLWFFHVPRCLTVCPQRIYKIQIHRCWFAKRLPSLFATSGSVLDPPAAPNYQVSPLSPGVIWDASYGYTSQGRADGSFWDPQQVFCSRRQAKHMTSHKTLLIRLNTRHFGIRIKRCYHAYYTSFIYQQIPSFWRNFDGRGTTQRA